MIIGIDASNIRKGGGLTHLKALLQHAQPKSVGISKIILWSSEATLKDIPEFIFIEKRSHALLNKSTLHCFLFQFIYLKKEAADCDLLLVPGGTFISSFRPFVTLSQNMLPFDVEQSKAYGFKMKLRLKLLYYTQSYTFKRAEGLIFLTQYAKKNIVTKMKWEHPKAIVIPHGVHRSFQLQPRYQQEVSCYNKDNLFEFLYVSYITVYKHQWNIAEAVCQLHQLGLPIKLKLVGSVLDSFDLLKDVYQRYPNSSECLEYIGDIPHEELSHQYHNADAFVFGSSCENLPIILLEAMIAGLPIASSNYGPMGEVLGSSAVYFNPYKISSIKNALQLLFENHELRHFIANNTFDKGKNYTWNICAQKTLKYTVERAHHYHQKKH